MILYGIPIFKNLSSNSLVWNIALTKMDILFKEYFFFNFSISSLTPMASSFPFLKEFNATRSPSSPSVKRFLPILASLFDIILDATDSIFWVDL